METNNAAESDNLPRLISTEEFANLLGVSTQTIARHRRLGTGPAYYQINDITIRYLLSDVLEWIESSKRK